MLSIKVKFRSSAVPDSEGTIYYQLIRDRKVRQLNTLYRVYPAEWDEKRGSVIASRGSKRKREVVSIREHIRYDLERLVKIERQLEARGLGYSVDEIIEEFRRYKSEYTLFNYMEGVIDGLKSNGKIRTSETYRAALLSFRKFRDNEDIMLDNINTTVIERFESWHRRRGNVPNTISFYVRIIRAVYNRAVDAEIIENRHPFRHVYTGIDKTVKRALPLAKVKQIKTLNLAFMPPLDYARDMFMISFYLRGMSFIDMAFLKKSDLRDGYVMYRRRKTGQRLTIKWTKEMQKIIDKYPENSSEYLLPVIRSKVDDELYEYRNIGYNINRSLKRIGHMIGMTIPLTLYVARHSWASAARSKGIPVSVISEGMGHDNESTTRIYLASIDTSEVDKANNVIIRAVNS
ncbi:MAG: site-specific integrase [Muribaculaceae bacterium]|nr:site-specific integrase [Muribaculaceae bacterium]